jgi:hypothetical protein
MTGCSGSQRNQLTWNYHKNSHSDLTHSYKLTEGINPQLPTCEPETDQEPARKMDQQPTNEGNNPPPPDHELTPEMIDQLTCCLVDSQSTLTCNKLLDRSIELELIHKW